MLPEVPTENISKTSAFPLGYHLSKLKIEEELNWGKYH